MKNFWTAYEKPLKINENIWKQWNACENPSENQWKAYEKPLTSNWKTCENPLNVNETPLENHWKAFEKPLKHILIDNIQTLAILAQVALAPFK